jgi:hypothetical protein
MRWLLGILASVSCQKVSLSMQKHKMNPLVWAETELACENRHLVCKQVHSNQALHHCALRLHWESEGTDIGPTDGCLAHPRQPPPPVFRPFQAWALQLPDT